MEYKKNRYDYWWYDGLEFFCILPTVLSLFPVPLFLPILAIYELITDPQHPFPPILYFTWLITGILIIRHFENKDK